MVFGTGQSYITASVIKIHSATLDVHSASDTSNQHCLGQGSHQQKQVRGRQRETATRFSSSGRGAPSSPSDIVGSCPSSWTGSGVIFGTHQYAQRNTVASFPQDTVVQSDRSKLGTCIYQHVRWPPTWDFIRHDNANVPTDILGEKKHQAGPGGLMRLSRRPSNVSDLFSLFDIKHQALAASIKHTL